MEMFVKIFYDLYVIEVIRNFFLIVIVIVLIVFFFGVLFGYVLVRKDFFGKSVV